MALTNKERQARWRERVKARASMPIAEAFREYMRAEMTDGWLGSDEDADAACARAARDAVLGKTDDELSNILDDAFSRLFEAEYIRLAKAKRRSERSKRRLDEAVVTDEDWPQDIA
ncbi:hypothetical protein [Methylocystis echinoides]|uniref:hypothetical protein n=1 Tax=Methylocystis echinoides TaxID=29468 RepID=UPI00341C14BF